MYKIMYKKDGETNWQCLGLYADMEIALGEMDKLQSGILGESGTFKMKREGSK